MILTAQGSLNLSALVDCGCDFDLINQTFILLDKIETKPLPTPLQVSILDESVFPK